MLFELDEKQLPLAVKAEYERLKEDIGGILLEGPISLDQIQRCILAIEIKIKWLKAYLLDQPLMSVEDEIFFFKRIKPLFVSELIYYSKLYKIEIRRPIGSKKAEKSYLANELNYLNHYFESNQEFYQYYRSGVIYMDREFFTRAAQETKPFFYSSPIDSDKSFSTNHDYMVSKILSNDQLRQYLLKEINKLKKKEQTLPGDSTPVSSLTWTATLASFNEMIYGLRATGAINNGNATLSQIAAVLGKALNVKAGNVYRRQQENRLRKDRSPFLRDMIRKSEEDMDQSDENPHPTSK